MEADCIDSDPAPAQSNGAQDSAKSGLESTTQTTTSAAKVNDFPPVHYRPRLYGPQGSKTNEKREKEWFTT
jgi:hypothetical protein